MLETVRAHSPLVRNRLIMLFSGKKYEDLTTPEGIEALRIAALGEVQKAMKEVTGKKTVKDLFFTSFVMQ
jgi:flagellar FliL protein